MKRNLLLPCLVAGWWAIALPAAFAETPSEEINRLRAEIGELEIQLTSPTAGSQQTMLRQSLREKIRRMEEAQQQLRSGASTNAPRPAAPAPTEPPPPRAAPSTAPARETAPMPGATLPPPRAAASAPPREIPPPPAAAPAAPRVRATAAAPSSSAPLPEVPLPGAAPLTIYTAQELAIGPGTMSNLDEVARLLRTKSYDDARREWNGYVAGERDLFEAQPTRLKALIHFVARRAFVEPDDELSIAAAQVDAARERKDAAGIAQAQDAFTARLSSRAELAAQVRQALGLLQTVADNAMRPRR